jgi:hypothetical protein
MSEPDVTPAEQTESGAGSGGRSEDESGDRLRSAGEQASSAVIQAASVLESELAGGIEEARRLQSKFTEQRRLEPGDLDELAGRVRRSAHDLIDVLTERVHDLGAQDVQDLAGRLGKDAHSVLDGVMDLVGVVPDVVNRLMERADAMQSTAEPTAAAADTAGPEASGIPPAKS